MVVARFSWPEMDMAVVSDKQMMKKFGPQVPWDTLRAKSVGILTQRGAMPQTSEVFILCVKAPFVICVSRRCVQHGQMAVGVDHSP